MSVIKINATEFSSNFYFTDEYGQPQSFHINEIVPLITPTLLDGVIYHKSIKVKGIMYGINTFKRKGKIDTKRWKHNIRNIDMISLEVKKKHYPLTKV
jgi:hypothetical protein